MNALNIKVSNEGTFILKKDNNHIFQANQPVLTLTYIKLKRYHHTATKNHFGDQVFGQNGSGKICSESEKRSRIT